MHNKNIYQAVIASFPNYDFLHRLNVSHIVKWSTVDYKVTYTDLITYHTHLMM